MSSGKRVLSDGVNCTSRPGIFAAGDVTAIPAEQVLVALGEGAKAALMAYEYLLREHESLCGHSSVGRTQA
jgi:alkyl hydroperoxide reductase subunit F